MLNAIRAVRFLVLALLIGTAPLAGQDPQTPDSMAVELGALRADVTQLAQAIDSLNAALSAAPAQAADGVTVESVQEGAARFGFRALLAVVLLVLTGMAVRLSSWVLGQLAERTVERRLFYKRIEPLLRIALWATGGVVVLRGVFNIDAGTLLTAGAALGVAIGFAAQDIMKNIFGGLVILADRPFQVGDKIEVGGTYGEVVAIGLRSTRIVTPDDNLVSVPNAQVVDGQVSNANAGALDCQVVTEIHLPGWVDTKAARAIAYRAAATSRFVYRDKPIVVLVRDEYKETFHTVLSVKAYVLDIRFESAFRSDVTERARDGLKGAGLVPPWFGAYSQVSLPLDWEPSR